MSVRAYFDTWCDVQGERCKDWAEGGTGDSFTEARANAKRLGWKNTTLRTADGGMIRGADVCPECQKDVT